MNNSEFFSSDKFKTLFEPQRSISVHQEICIIEETPFNTLGKLFLFCRQILVTYSLELDAFPLIISRA